MRPIRRFLRGLITAPFLLPAGACGPDGSGQLTAILLKARTNQPAAVTVDVSDDVRKYFASHEDAASVEIRLREEGFFVRIIESAEEIRGVCGSKAERLVSASKSLRRLSAGRDEAVVLLCVKSGKVVSMQGRVFAKLI